MKAAQKLGKKKKRHQTQEPEPLPSYPTKYAEVVRMTPPPVPPCLLRTVGRLQNPGMGKVKVMLKICNSSTAQGEQGSSFLSPDPRKKQVTVFDPSASGYVTSANRRAATAAPKMFAFDSVFTPDDSLTELCAGSLSEMVQAVVAGADGCLFTYGYSKLGKSHTMLGTDQSGANLGVMPCAISWLFRLINDQKDKTGARFSVRVSAVHVSGKEEVLKDLLADVAQGTEATGVGAAPSVYLREDPICGTQLENQSELRAPTADKAAHYLDAALAARNIADEDEARSSHLLFTLSVYQYRIEKANTKAGLPGVAGGRSRLHLIDLGTASKSKEPNNVSLSLSALGNVIMALLNGQRHVPHRDSKIAQLLRDSLGNLSCRTCMVAHVSSAVPHYNETLQVIQLAARIHRMKRRRTKFSSTSSEDSSTDGDIKFRRPYRGLRMGTLREDILYSSSLSDPDYTSSSEQSCDTVIYIGSNGQSLSDRELTDNEGPPRHVPRTNPRLPRRPSGSRSSGDDSDSGRSVRSVKAMDSRLPVRALVSPTPGQRSGHTQSMPGSPNPGLVKTSHRMGNHTKLGSSTETKLSSSDKPTKVHVHSSQSKLAKSIHDKQQPLEGEQWIDGPGAAIYPEPPASERWIDGPQAFVVHQQNQQQQQAALSSSPSSKAEIPHQHHRSESSSHHRGESSRRAASRKVDAEEQWVDGPREMVAGSNPSQPMHTCSKTELHPPPSATGQPQKQSGVNEKALKQALVKHLMESKDRRDSNASLDSNSSVTVEAAESRPASFLEQEEQRKIKQENSETTSSNTLLSSKKQKLSDHKKSHTSLQSPKHSPNPSPGTARKSHRMDATQNLRLQKSQLPGSASPTNRVRQWIKSVSSADKQETVELPQDSRPTDDTAPNTSQLLGSVLMTDAETNTEHDSDFERMAEENGVRSDGEEGAETKLSNLAVKCEMIDSSTDKCNNTLDVSMDSSFDTSGVNRESVYEMEIEERLELMKAKDGTRLAADVDNETFSSLSCSGRDPDEIDKDQHESLLVQHTIALTESKQTAQLAKHLAAGYQHRDPSSAYSDYDNEIPDCSQPLLSRKPDGASNPNLAKTYVEEDFYSKEQYPPNNAGTTVEMMCVMSSHNDSGIDFPTTSSKSCRSGVGETDSLCDTDLCVQSLSGKQEGTACNYVPSLKLSTKNKPPLPSKSSPTPSHKLSANGHSPSQSPVSRTNSISRSPHSGKEKSPVGQQKPNQSSSGKAAALSSSSQSIRGRLCSRSDKASSSSIGNSQSPTSSATSSPLVSSTSKCSSSASSSPSQKASSKVQNGFCSSRTSSPSSKDNGKQRKKEKEKEKDAKCSNVRATKLADIIHKGKGNDSDSGNDSGIVAHEKRLLSPYATVTKPRTPSHSSSGHGSDNSTVSTEVHPGRPRPLVKPDTVHGGTSSGYESMLRDSEATASSSGQEDSGSESSTELKKSGGKKKGTRRSRSAPARSAEDSPTGSQPCGSRSVGSSGQKGWADSKHLKGTDEALELKHYDTDDLDRMAKRIQEEEIKSSPESKRKDGSSKGDASSDSKDHIVMERNGWSFDCKLLMCFSCKSRPRATDV